MRTRLSKGKVERRTYVSTLDPLPQVTLFCEVGEGQSPGKVSTKNRILEDSGVPIVYMGTLTAPRGSDAVPNTPDLLVAKKNGEIYCLDGDSLAEKWVSPASALGREFASTSDKGMIIEFAELTNAVSASQGILQGSQDVFALFPQEISEQGFNPDVLVIVARYGKKMPSRTVHIVTLPRRSAALSQTITRPIESLLSMTLPPTRLPWADSFIYHLQASSGVLQQLTPYDLSTFEFKSTVPTVVSTIKLEGGNALVPLTKSSTMVSTAGAMTLYNTKYCSIIASMDVNGTSNQKKRKRLYNEPVKGGGCRLVSYFPKLSTAIALAGNDLVAIQIEGKLGATGLMIDSLGSSVPYPYQTSPGRRDTSAGLNKLGSCPTGSIRMPEKKIGRQMKPLNALYEAGDAAEFDNLMAEKLGGSWLISASANAHVKAPATTNGSPAGPVSVEKEFVQSSTVDQRWVKYALNKIFSWAEQDNGEFMLVVSFYPPNVFLWLLETGNMTISNLDDALRDEIRYSSLDALPSGELVRVLVEMDPDMELLHGLISKTILPAGELVSAIRSMMQSIGLFGDDEAAAQQAIRDGEDANLESEDGSMEDDVKVLEAQIESDLALAEFRLGQDSDRRGEALEVALAKLYACPSDGIVHALQTIFSAQEIMALIYQLRYQLRNGSWTTRYHDMGFEAEDDEDVAGERQENSIIVITSLLHNCIDSIGAGGWISGDDRLLANEDPFEAEEFIAGLSFEIGAVLEGIEEAEYIRGLVGCVLRHGQHLGSAGKLARKRKAVQLPSVEESFQMLPLGLKAPNQISLEKVHAPSGLIDQLTKREIGLLKSKQIGVYTLERIDI